MDIILLRFSILVLMDMWNLFNEYLNTDSDKRIADKFLTCIKKELGIDAAYNDELEKLFEPTEEKLLLLNINITIHLTASLLLLLLLMLLLLL